MLVKINEYLDIGPYKLIPLSVGLFAKVSPEDYEWLNKHKWYAKKSFSKYYAVRKVTTNGKVRYIWMSRAIACTRANEVCHHRNKDSLDNRRKNLQNLSYFDHVKMHSWR